jgi:hypothetical protein
MFLQSVRNAVYITHTKTATCFSTRLPSSGIYYNKSLRANLLLYYLFIFISLIKRLVVKIHRIYKIYEIDVVNNLLFTSRKIQRETT